MEERVYRTMYELENRHWWFRGRRAVVAALLRRTRLAAHPRILDAGCGTGRNLQEYARLGPAWGVDPSPSAIEFCRRRGLRGVIRSGIEDMPFDEGEFDLLCATDVLEHIDDDRAALRELHRVASANAVLLVTVPAYGWLWSDGDVALQHRRRYTRPDLVGRASEAGWQAVVATYFNALMLGPIALTRRLRRDRGLMRDELGATPSWIDTPLSIPMRLEALAISGGIRLPAGVSVGMVCRRA